MGTVSNLLAGTGTLYIGPDGEALPEINNLTPPTVTVTPGGNWSATGFTIDDMVLEYTAEHEKHWVNEHLMPVKATLTQEDAKISVTLDEDDFTAFSQCINASTLATTAAGADQTAQDKLGVGDGTMTYKSLLLLETSPEAGSRILHIYKAIQSGAIAFARTKGKHPGKRVTFEIIGDPTKTDNERFFKWYDITAAASS